MIAVFSIQTSHFNRMNPTAPRNHSLDALRALAVAMVFAAHAIPLTAESPIWIERVATFGQRGVDLFFVLSGYLIGSIVLREFYGNGRISIFQFWRNRWYRTMPAYYVTLALYLLKELVPHRSEGLGNPYSYIFFLQSYLVGHLTDFAHSWSLCVEEHFYLGLPLILFVTGLSGDKAREKFIILLVAASLATILIRSALIVEGEDVYEKLSHWRTDGLAVGLLISALELRSHMFRRFTSEHFIICTTGTIVLIASAIWLHAVDSAHWQPVVALACGGAVILGVRQNSALESVGRLPFVAWAARISYSLYLLHPLVLGALALFYFSKHFHQPGFVLAYAALGLVISLIAAQLSYFFVERTFLNMRDRSRRPSSPDPIPASPRE